MRTTLFRQDALEFREQRMFGAALVAAPLSLRIITAAACALAACLISFACWGQYTPKVRVSGYLAPSGGLIRILATQTGTLIEQRVKEGQQVRQGDTLYVLSTEEGSLQEPRTQSAAIGTIEERLASLHREMTTGRRINDVQSRGIREQLKDAAGELDALRSEIDSQGQRVDIAESNAKRYEDLRAKGLVSEIQLQERRDESLGQRMHLQELERGAVTLRRETDKLSYDLGAAELQGANQRESAEREVAALQLQLTEYQARRTILITAPADGTATGILGAQGQRTSPQMLLLTILPAKARLEAQLLVPSRAIGFLAVGERVSLHLQPFPYQQFGSRKGRVTEISKTLVSPSDAQSPIAATEATYRVVVALDSEFIHTGKHDFPLEPGMLLDADIWLQHRRIIEWLSDPLADALGAVRT